MSWARKFDSPIKAPDGKTLRTLKDAAEYVLALPPTVQVEEAWQTAAQELKHGAEREKAWMFFARLAMMHALHRHSERPEPRLSKAERFKAKREAAKRKKAAPQ